MENSFDDNDFVETVRKMYGPLHLFARQWSEILAEDAVQVALLKLAQAMQEGNKPNNVSAWLFQVVRNELKYGLRQQKTAEKHVKIYAESQPPWFVPSEDARLDGQLVAEKLALLPLDQREAIVARIWGDLSFEEIATLLGTSSSTAHRRYTAGIETLRKMLQRWTK